MTIETKIIDGKARAAQLRATIASEVAALKTSRGITPGLAVVQVGAVPASDVYVKNKIKSGQEAGINSFKRWVPEDITQEGLLAEVKSLNESPDVHGILVQLPLPKHIDEHAILLAINPDKDVDGFHPANVGRLWSGHADALVPCTPLGCLMMLKEELGDLTGKTAVVVGRSNIVGKPMAALLLQENCTVTVAHSRTANLADVVRSADIVVAAVGKPLMIKGSWIKTGATVIDVGINRISLPDGSAKLLGDVAFDECIGIAGAITPVPGGVGPMTIAVLLKNTMTAVKLLTK